MKFHLSKTFTVAVELGRPFGEEEIPVLGRVAAGLSEFLDVMNQPEVIIAFANTQNTAAVDTLLITVNSSQVLPVKFMSLCRMWLESDADLAGKASENGPLVL